MQKDSKIYISGHTGMVGKTMYDFLQNNGYTNLVVRTSSELDLRNQKQVNEFFEKEKPEYVFHFAAKVGGIMANVNNPAEFFYDNVMITSNVIHGAYKSGVKKLLNLGSSCIYPAKCEQPMKEEHLMTGTLEPTNEGYALAKIIGLKLCETYNKQNETNFISLMPCNIYGVNEHFDLKNSHVLSALVKKFVDAKSAGQKSVTLWGAGVARREFMYSEDVAEACHYFMQNFDAKDLPSFVNIGSGTDVSIKELAELISSAVGFEGDIEYDTSKPDGMLQKLLNVDKAKSLGWSSKVSLEEGVQKTINYYKENYATG
ncbi:GDP-L-fucose synthase family protein [Patescibacteria group bacterium]